MMENVRFFKAVAKAVSLGSEEYDAQVWSLADGAMKTVDGWEQVGESVAYDGRRVGQKSVRQLLYEMPAEMKGEDSEYGVFTAYDSVHNETHLGVVKYGCGSHLADSENSVDDRRGGSGRLCGIGPDPESERNGWSARYAGRREPSELASGAD